MANVSSKKKKKVQNENLNEVSITKSFRIQFTASCQ